ncbi:hypothetical protein [Pendulispora albinea]|uniref:Uncharacterized protein n=1 Tax=Pendulispora albinea TaxID=2741071 RepID=A0ABZ2M5P9_9BACT
MTSRSRSRILLPLVLLFPLLTSSALTAGCGAADPEGGSMSLEQNAGARGDVTSASFARASTSDIFAETFEGAPVGALGSEWTLAGGAPSSLTVDNGASGHLLRLHGDKGSGFVVGSRAFPNTTRDLTVTYDIWAEEGSSQQFSLGGYRKGQIRLFRTDGIFTAGVPGAMRGDLLANTPRGNVDCGPLPSNTWVRVTLRLRFSTHSYDVLFNDAPTACMNLPNEATAADKLTIQDPANDGLGGESLWDNFRVF